METTPVGGASLTGGRESAEDDNGLKFQTPSENVSRAPAFFTRSEGCVEALRVNPCRRLNILQT